MGSGPIQVFPPGFLGYLQLKNQGRNPNQLPDDLAAVLDVREWLLQANMEEFEPNVVHGRALATGNTSFRAFSPNAITVPQNQWWWVDTFSILTGDLVAGDSINLRPALTTQSAGTQITHSLRDDDHKPTGFGVGDAVLVAARRFFAPPGASFGIWVHNIAAATTISFVGSVRRAVLPI